jgi:predicted  nucleic acid-binding Zn-ribbon protein
LPAHTPAPLDRLYQLQEILLEIKVKSERRAKTPDHLVHVEAAYQDALLRRNEGTARLKTAEERRKVLADEIADLNEGLKKFQAQQKAVKTNKEYGALLNEMDNVKKEIRTREDEILSLEEVAAEARTAAESQDDSFPVEAAGYEEQMTEWRAEQAALTAEIEKGEAKAAELRKQVDRKLLAVFDRIAQGRAGVAVARVSMVGNQTAACSACNVRLRPQLLSDLRLSRETIHCESCKRILYWDPRLDV